MRGSRPIGKPTRPPLGVSLWDCIDLDELEGAAVEQRLAAVTVPTCGAEMPFPAARAPIGAEAPQTESTPAFILTCGLRLPTYRAA